MVISYVVRLRPDALADGRFVGEIEAVTSRDRCAIRTVEQMTKFILATMPAQVGDGWEALERIEERPAGGGRTSAVTSRTNRS